jgi:hypothetical protein
VAGELQAVTSEVAEKIKLKGVRFAGAAVEEKDILFMTVAAAAQAEPGRKGEFSPLRDETNTDGGAIVGSGTASSCHLRIACQPCKTWPLASSRRLSPHTCCWASSMALSRCR